MIYLTSLWLPMILSAVAVFIVSTIIHLLLPYHKSDFKKLPSETEILDVMSKAAIPPGEYMMPFAGSMKETRSPEFIEKWKKGPHAFVTATKVGATPSMTKNLAQWFVYCLVVSIFAGFIAGRALGPGALFIGAFKFTCAVAFMGYVLALWQQTVWYGRPVSTNLKASFDGLIYAIVTAAVFGWLWPAA